jgi:hypothetical protein
MKRKKIDIDKVLEQGLPKMSRKEIESSQADALERIRKELGGKMDGFMAEETPASKAVKRIKATDRLVLRSIQILEGKADLNKMLGIVNELGDEPIDLDDITMSLERLDRKGAISLKALFPMDAEAQTQEDAVTGREHLKAGDWAKEKS